MHLYAPLAVCLLSATLSDATLFSHTTSFANRVHHSAVKRSAGLARDIRTAMKGILVEQRASTNSGSRVFCVANNAASSLSGSNTGNTTIVPGPPISSSSGTPANHGGSSTSTSTSNQPSSTPSGSSDWALNQTYAGSDFFNGWTFWDTTDPTNGVVDYLSQSDAQSDNLTSINSAGNALMKVDTTQTITGNRKSVRITTEKTWTGGLFIMDSVHMPAGCGTWPAFWSNGPNWPQGGEIDIVEGVNDYTNNQATIHTDPGCSLVSSSASVLSITGTLVASTDCAAADTGNAGCGIRSSSDVSYGAPFNGNGGGVYAMQWDASGIAVYFFPRNAIPSDITANAPQPTNWGAAMARWPAIDCDPYKFFYDHSFIFDTTLCGDWASGVWSSTGVPGQDQSCAARTGYSTCEQFVQSSGSSFAEAYWEVKSFQVYQAK